MTREPPHPPQQRAPLIVGPLASRQPASTTEHCCGRLLGSMPCWPECARGSRPELLRRHRTDRQPGTRDGHSRRGFAWQATCTGFMDRFSGTLIQALAQVSPEGRRSSLPNDGRRVPPAIGRRAHDQCPPCELAPRLHGVDDRLHMGFPGLPTSWLYLRGPGVAGLTFRREMTGSERLCLVLT